MHSQAERLEQASAGHANAIAFIDYVIAKFPFRIREVRTDNGHEFQAKLHWHVEDQGIRHAYIKPSSPQLNGKVERSHRTDEHEIYQLLTYNGDVDLHQKLAEWEDAEVVDGIDPLPDENATERPNGNESSCAGL